MRAPYDIPTRSANPPLVAGVGCRPQTRPPPCSRQRVSRATRTILGRLFRIRKVRFEGAAARPRHRAKSATALAAAALAATDPIPPPSSLLPRPPPPSPPPAFLSPPQPNLPSGLPATAAACSPTPSPHRYPPPPSALTSSPPPTSASALAVAAGRPPSPPTRHRA